MINLHTVIKKTNLIHGIEMQVTSCPSGSDCNGAQGSRESPCVEHNIVLCELLRRKYVCFIKVNFTVDL